MILQYVFKEAAQINWQSLVKRVLLTSIDDVRRILFSDDTFAFDTETTGLSYLTDTIVGFSFAMKSDPNTGYYVPLYHVKGVNAPAETLKVLADAIKQGKLVLAYNKKFDLNMLSLVHKLDIGNGLNIVDVMSLVWNVDLDLKMPSLKWASAFYLGILQPTYEEVVGKIPFSYLTPEESVDYAALDAVTTFKLFQFVLAKHPEVVKLSRIDDPALEFMRRSEHNNIKIDVEWLKKELIRCDQRMSDLRKQIYSIVGYSFNINSPAEKADALLTSGARLSKKTKTGKWQTKKDVLAELDHPLARVLVEFSEEVKYQGAYVLKLLKEAERMGGYARFNYMLMAAPTGRYACGTDQKNPYFTSLNVQSVPKPKFQDWAIIKDPSCTKWMGWRRVSIEEAQELKVDYYKVEGAADFHLIRCAITVEDGEIYISLDYSAQELRIAAIMSGEQVWLEAFKHGIDIHMNTAKAIWGPDVDKNKRKKAKVGNFGLGYGGTPFTLVEKLKIPLSEAKVFYQQYRSALPTLFRWKDYLMRLAKKKDIYTYYGRVRRMMRYYHPKAEKSERGFGDRTALNHPVQGLAGDVLRIVCGKLHRLRLAQPQYNDKWKFALTVHDQVDFIVKQDFFWRFLKVIVPIMTVQEKEWPIPLIVELELGPNWGEALPFHFDLNTQELTPNGEFVPYKSE